MPSHLRKAQLIIKNAAYWVDKGDAERGTAHAQLATAHAAIAIAKSLDELAQIEHNRFEHQLKRGH